MTEETKTEETISVKPIAEPVSKEAVASAVETLSGDPTFAEAQKALSVVNPVADIQSTTGSGDQSPKNPVADEAEEKKKAEADAVKADASAKDKQTQGTSSKAAQNRINRLTRNQAQSRDEIADLKLQNAELTRINQQKASPASEGDLVEPKLDDDESRDEDGSPSTEIWMKRHDEWVEKSEAKTKAESKPKEAAKPKTEADPAKAPESDDTADKLQQEINQKLTRVQSAATDSDEVNEDTFNMFWHSLQSGSIPLTQPVLDYLSDETKDVDERAKVIKVLAIHQERARLTVQLPLDKQVDALTAIAKENEISKPSESTETQTLFPSEIPNIPALPGSTGTSNGDIVKHIAQASEGGDFAQYLKATKHLRV